MNTPRPPSEEEIDRLLASRFRDTTPEFEARWRDLRRELRQAPAPRRSWPAWWPGLAAAGMTLAAVLVVYHPWTTPSPSPETRFSPEFTELFAMDEILGRATPLLDPENRDVLLHLPTNPPPSTTLSR
jgi:hypothetical protein